MPGAGDNVGSAYVSLHVDAGPGEAELAAFKAKVDRDFAELDRKKAEASLQLKSAEFDAKINKAKQELDNLEHRKARTSVELDKAKFDAEIAEAKAEIKALGREKATINIDARQVRAANRETRLLADAHRLEERAALQSAKAEQRVVSERQRATGEAIKARAEIARLSNQYEKLRGTQRSIEKESRRVFSKGGIGLSEDEARKLERLGAQLDHVRYKIESLGGSTSGLDRDMEKNRSLIDRWATSLSKVRLQMGPLSGTIRQFAIGVGTLAPLITELGGGLISLTGTIGAGLAGAAAVGAGGLAGLATSGLGVLMVVKPMITEFQEATKASAALSAAQKKYGAGSTQAKTAQEQLNHILAGTGPIARQAATDYGALTTKWHKMTGAARPAVFEALGQGIKTVQALLPTFASETTKTTQVAAKAWTAWMKGLRSDEARKLLGDVMKGFRDSIPGIAQGLGSLAAMFGHIAAAGAHFLPGLSGGFADWAANLEKAVGGGQKLTGEVGNMVSQMRDLGHLAQDTGSLLVHFFGASTTAGHGMVKSLDGVIRRWDAWTASTHGQESLKTFFGESKTATEDFGASLVHITKWLFELSRATAPVANGLLTIVTSIGNFVSGAEQLAPLRDIIRGVGIALGAAFVAGKVLAYADSIKTVIARVGAFMGIMGAETTDLAANTAALDANTAALATNAAAAADAAVAEAELGAVDLATGLDAGAAAATRAALGLEETAGAAGLLATALTPEVLIPAGVIVGLGVLAATLVHDSNKFEELAASSKQAGTALKHNLSSSTVLVDKYVAAQHRHVSVANEVDAAQRRVVKLQNEGASANKVTRAVEEMVAAERRQVQVAHETGVINKKQIVDQEAIAKNAKTHVKSLEQETAAMKAQIKQEEELPLGSEGKEELADERKALAAAEHELAAAKRDVARAQKQEAATAVPYERSIKGLKPISDATEQALRRLANTIGAAATKKIGNFVNPQDIAKVTNLSNSLTNLGRGGQVKNIAVKSQGADQTIAKLQRLQKQTNRVEAARATVHIGANDTQANAKLKRLSALSQRVAGTAPTVHILANSANAEQAIHRLQSHLHHLALERYEAKIEAIDHTQGPSAAAKKHLREAAGAKYTAEIKAVDRASSTAKSAEGAGKRAAGRPYKLNITASNAQALSAIQAVQSGLASLHSKTVSVNVVTHRSGHAEGGPAAYVPAFASGGQTNFALQRAADRAVMQPGGRSQKVRRPTMLTGEEAPRHPEYVIATNPAYRQDNTRYLDQAAAHLGYEVVPAARRGAPKLHGPPLFNREGPSVYAAALKHNQPFATHQAPWQTHLNTRDERAFRAWVHKHNVPFNPDSKRADYDMRGFWKATGGAWHGGHFPDTWKTPYDTAFSNESKYARGNTPFVYTSDFHWLYDSRSGQEIINTWRWAEGGKIPAFKRGKGKKGNGGGKGGGESRAEKTQKTLAHHPPKPKHRAHKIAKVEKWGPVAAYNQAETDAGIKEEIYGQVFSHDEAEIKAGRMDQWEFGRLRQLLSEQAADYRRLGNLVPDIRQTVHKELGRIHGLVDGKGQYSKKAISNLNHSLGVEKAKLGKLKQGKNESDAAFRKRKRPFEHAITKIETEKHRAEKERDRLIGIRSEAKQELSEVTGARKMNEAKTNAERSEDELQYIEDVESGAVEAPYDEGDEEVTPEMEYAKAALIRAELEHNAGAEEAARKQMVEVAEREYSAALATPSPKDDIEKGEQLKQLREEAASNGGKGTIGEQTASYNEARAQLYQQFASNIFGQLTPGAAPGVPPVGASGGSPNYLPGSPTALAAATPALQGGSTHAAKAGKIEVVNNFAAPPPDPHTWTRQQEFELGALA